MPSEWHLKRANWRALQVQEETTQTIVCLVQDIPGGRSRMVLLGPKLAMLRRGRWRVLAPRCWLAAGGSTIVREYRHETISNAVTSGTNCQDAFDLLMIY